MYYRNDNVHHLPVAVGKVLIYRKLAIMTERGLE